VTAIISSIAGATVHNEPAYVDIRAWRGDDLILPFTFFDDATEVTDGVTTAGSGVLISASAPWVSGDANKAIVGDKIPFGSTIGTFTDSQHVTLAGAVEATGTKTYARFRWGPAADESAATFSAQVRAHPDATDVMASFTIDASQSVDGLITASIPTGIMKGLRVGRFHRVLAGVERTLMAGAFVVLGDTTRP
jgi:hypothetical protein